MQWTVRAGVTYIALPWLWVEMRKPEAGKDHRLNIPRSILLQLPILTSSSSLRLTMFFSPFPDLCHQWRCHV